MAGGVGHAGRAAHGPRSRPAVFRYRGALPHPPPAGADRKPASRTTASPASSMAETPFWRRGGAGRAGLFRLADGPAGHALAHRLPHRAVARPRAPVPAGGGGPFAKRRRGGSPGLPPAGAVGFLAPLRPGWTRRRRFSPAWRAKSPAGCWTRCAPLRG